MTTTTIDTGVPGTSAAHLRLLRDSTGTHDSLTVVWSTHRVWCEPGDTYHATAQWPAGSPPLVWDTTGAGTWDVGAHVKCHRDGTLLGPTAVLHVGRHLTGPELRAAAEGVAQAAATAEAGVVESVRARLARDLADWLAGDRHAAGSATTTGVWEPPHGEPEAWTYHPFWHPDDGDDVAPTIVVTAADLA